MKKVIEKKISEKDINNRIELITMTSGQASLEYILILAFSLLLAGFLWIKAAANIENTELELQMAYAKNALDKIVQTSDITFIKVA